MREQIPGAKAAGGDAGQSAAAPVRFSVVVLTFARDLSIEPTLASLEAAIGARRDVEVILVDNNPDAVDRAPLIARFARPVVVKTGENRGVSARNDGMAAAAGEFIVLLDDDVLIQSLDLFERLEADFAAHPDVGLVNVRKLDAATLRQRKDCIPHTNKKIDPTKPFLTFKFIGGLVALRRAVFEATGGYNPTIFFGAEEKEYSYRIIGAGWKIYYDPAIVALEQNAPGGRPDIAKANTDLVMNTYKIAFLHKPWPAAMADASVFTLFMGATRFGKVSIPGALAGFRAWLRRPDRPRRRPLDAQALAYIRACGGATWR